MTKLSLPHSNDAERGWAVGEWLFKINIGLAFIGLISSKAALLLIALGWVQFVYGLALPANPLPNIHGFPHPDTPALRHAAWEQPFWRRCCR